VNIMPSLDEALVRYEKEITPTKRSPYSEHSRIRTLRRDSIVHRPLASIRTADLAQWRDKARKRLSASTTNRFLTLISGVYKVAASEWGMEGLPNPVRGLRRPSEPPGRDRRLRPGEEEQLLAVLPPHLQTAFIWALETAMRQGEMLGLRREDIQGRIARLRITKNGHPRAVPLSRCAYALLDLLPSEGKLWTVTRRTFSHQWRQACRDARILDLRWHDLRHEAVSRLFEKGLTAEEVMKISGHQTYAMLARYTHLRLDDLVAKLG
jgi:integrase